MAPAPTIQRVNRACSRLMTVGLEKPRCGRCNMNDHLHSHPEARVVTGTPRDQAFHEHHHPGPNPGQPFTDPVCGMKVAAHARKEMPHEGHTYHFCSAKCMHGFRAYSRTTSLPARILLRRQQRPKARSTPARYRMRGTDLSTMRDRRDCRTGQIQPGLPLADVA